ncbi:hypothetical protein PPOLYM_01449 [Paenibacillus polymyxa]|nr:hypothetical protein PPOLYM_01449 [Paenibacillus polymyxa]
MIKCLKLLFDISIAADLSLDFPTSRFGYTSLKQQIDIVNFKLMRIGYGIQYVFDQTFIFLLMKGRFNFLYDDYFFLTIDFRGKYSDGQGQLWHILLDGPFNIDGMMVFAANNDDFLLSTDDIDMIIRNKAKVPGTKKAAFFCIRKGYLKSAIRFFLPV